MSKEKEEVVTGIGCGLVFIVVVIVVGLLILFALTHLTELSDWIKGGIL